MDTSPETTVRPTEEGTELEGGGRSRWDRRGFWLLAMLLGASLVCTALAVLHVRHDRTMSNRSRWQDRLQEARQELTEAYLAVVLDGGGAVASSHERDLARLEHALREVLAVGARPAVDDIVDEKPIRAKEPVTELVAALRDALASPVGPPEGMAKRREAFQALLTALKTEDHWERQALTAFEDQLTREDERVVTVLLALIGAGGLGAWQLTRLRRHNRALKAKVTDGRRQLARTYATLAESEELMRMFIEHAPAALAMFDREMCYLTASRRWRDDFGLGDQPLIGRCHYEIFPEIGAAWKAVHRRTLAGAIERADSDSFVRADGTTQWLRWEARPWRQASGEIGGIVIFSEDVTVSHEAMAEAAQLAAIVESSRDAIIGLSLGGEVTTWNRGAATMFGYEAVEVVGKSVSILLLPDRPSEMTDLLADLSAGRSHLGVETQRRRKDGTVLEVELAVSPVYGPGGALSGASHIVRDVTNRKQAELALRDSELKFAMAFANNPAAISFTRLADGLVLAVNETWVQLMGYPREEIIGRSALSLWTTPEEAAQFVAEVRQRGGVRGREMTVRRKSGELIALEFSSQRMMLDGEEVILSSFVDLTARNSAAAARESERRRVVLLANVARQLVSTDLPRAVLREIFRGLAEELGLDLYKNYMISGEGGELRLAGAVGLTPEQEADFSRLRPGESLCGLVALRGKPLVFENLSVAVEPQAARVAALGIKAYAGYPLFAAGRLIGTVSFGLRTRTAFTADELQLLNAAADQVSAAMERSRLFDELRKSEQRHRMLFNTMVQGVVYHDAGGAVRALNPAAERILGLRLDELEGRASTAEEVEARTIREDGSKFPGSEHPAMVALREAREVRDVVMGVFNPRERRTRWLSIDAVPQFGEGAFRPTGVFVFFHDITDRRRAEEELREQEKLLLEMEQIAHVGGWRFDVETGGGSWTDEVSRIHDLPPEAPTSRDIGLKHYPPEARATIEAAIARAIERGEPYDLELPLVTASGRHKWVHTIGHPVMEEGRVVQLRGSFQDVTAHKRAELRTAIQAEVGQILSEAATLTAAAPAVLETICRGENWQFGAFWIMDAAQGQLAAMAIWQQPGMPLAALAAMTTSLRLGVGEGLPGIVWQERAVRVMPEVGDESRFLRRTVAAEAGLHSAMAFPLLVEHEVFGVMDFASTERHEDDDGLKEMFEMIGRQIGLFMQRRLAEDAVRELNAELEQRVQSRTAELEQANKELEAFSYSVSHDLRAPLRAVDGFARIVIEDFGPKLPALAQHYLANVAKGAQQMGALIDDLLAFSRLSRAPLARADCNFEQLVDGVWLELESMRVGRTVEWRRGELPAGHGDQALLRQVWINLLANALKYSRRREVAKIEVGCETAEGQTAFYVRDNGTGFDMRYAEKLFGVFQRLHRAEDYEGTGVGLAIVQRIVVRHGGRVWAESAIDQGATFWFTLGE